MPTKRQAKLAYLGPRGTFTEEAAQAMAQALGLGSEHLLPMEGLPAVLEAIGAGKARWAVVPAENSLEGSVNLTWDWLLQDGGLLIAGEEVLPVRHCLLGVPGADLAGIRTVLSHPQALAQCRSWLRRVLPRARQEETVSTAEAARRVGAMAAGARGEGRGLAAVGARSAASLYGLAVLAEDIQDVPDNSTRFLLLTRAPQEGQRWLAGPSGYDKTSVVCRVERDRPGSLFRILEPFARRQVNLTRVESRPARRQLGDYVFFMDLEGHAADPPVADSLQELQAAGSLLRILGSYPRSLSGR